MFFCGYSEAEKSVMLQSKLEGLQASLTAFQQKWEEEKKGLEAELERRQRYDKNVNNSRL